MKKALFLSVVFIANFSFAQINTAKLDSFLNILFEKNKAQGSVTITNNGQVVYNNAVGFLDEAKTQKVNTETKYRIGSITKMFTAVIMMQLIEEKKIALNTNLSKYYKQIPNSNKITIEHMLRHRSGLFNYTDDSLYLQIGNTVKTKDWFIKKFAGYKIQFQPNEKHEYSNTNYTLLTYIIEDITKKSFAQNIEERITQKLGLNKAFLLGDIDTKSNECFSFKSIDKTWMPEDFNTHASWLSGAGEIKATSAAVATFINGLFNEKLIKKESLTLMQDLKDGYGLGMIRLPFGKDYYYGHTGGIDGFNSCVGYNKDKKICVSVCCNGMNYDFNDILIAALSVANNVNYNIPTFTDNAIDFDLQKAAGIYASKELPIKFTITTNGKILSAQVTGQPSFPLDYKGNKTFVFDAAGVKIAFDLDKNEMRFLQGANDIIFTKEK